MNSFKLKWKTPCVDYELEVDAVREEDSAIGLFGISCPLISDYGEHQDGAKRKSLPAFNSLCSGSRMADMRSVRLGHRDCRPIIRDRHRHVVAMESALRVRRGHYFITSLPALEAENERTFSIRKYVVGGRGGRTQNDLVTSCVRLRMGRD
jgi:hypothetical protein